MDLETRGSKGRKQLIRVDVAIVLAAIFSAGPAVAQSEQAVTEALIRELAKRDAAIVELQRRVGQLERQAGAYAPRQPVPPAPQRPSPVSPERASPPQGVARGEVEEPSRAPGEFEVDEAAAERALERTLVQGGVLLLPFGRLEINPSFQYTRREDDLPLFVFEGDNTFIGTDRVRRDRYGADLQLRVGLPLDSQFEVRFPYTWVDQSRVTEVFGQPRDETNDNGSGFGDIRVGLAKTFVREAQWWPDLVGRVAWDSDSGEQQDGGVLLGNGFNELILGLSAVKRQDPLAFIGAANYSKAFESNDIEPGDEFGVSFGAVLAASPDTSLRFVFGGSWVDELKISGTRLKGSDQVLGTLTLGASSIVGRRNLLDLSTNIGLTDDGPDFALRLSYSTDFEFSTLFRGR